jgi:hypothetical protein
MVERVVPESHSETKTSFYSTVHPDTLAGCRSSVAMHERAMTQGADASDIVDERHRSDGSLRQIGGCYRALPKEATMKFMIWPSGSMRSGG